MIFTNRTVVSIAAAAMLLGGSAGAFINRSFSTEPEAANQAAPARSQASQPAVPAASEPLAEPSDSVESDSPYDFTTESAPQARLEIDPAAAAPAPRQGRVASARTPAPRRVYYNNRGSSRARTVSAPQQQRAYYDYNRKDRSFWQRHRDLLTVGIGAGTGAAIGGIAGGGKGAAIGALAGGGGSALWTYKLRKRN